MTSRSPSGERLVRALLARLGLALGLFAAALLAAAAVVAHALVAHGRLPTDNSLEIWFLEDDPALAAYRAFVDRWGNDEAVVVALFDPEGVLRAPTLDLVADLSRRLLALERVARVSSLATVAPVREDEEGRLAVGRHYASPVAEADLPAIRARILEDPVYRDHLLAPDGRATVLSIQLAASPDFDRARKATLAAVRATVEASLRDAGRPADAWAWGGIGVIHVALNDLVLADSARFAVWTQVLLALGLGLVFRRVVPVLACLAATGAASLLLVGAYLAAGLTLNMVTMVLPTLVMVVGLTDTVYFLVTFQQRRAAAPGLPCDEVVVQSLGFCLWPGLFNSVTTAVGFLAFLGARMEVLRHLGVFAGVGIACAFLSSLAAAALVLSRWPGAVEARGGATGRSPALARLAGFVARRRRAVLLASLGLAGLAVAGITRLQVDSYSLAYFHDDHPIRRDDRALLAAVGPYLPLELVLDAGADGEVKDPAVLGGLAALLAEVVAEEPTVGRAIALPAVARRIHEVLSGEPGAALPRDRATLEQELLFYDPERPDDPVVLVDLAWRRARCTLKIENEGARAAKLLFERILARAPAHLPPTARLEPGGYLPLYARLIEHLVWGQLESITVTALVVFLLVAALFRSWRWALLALAPNLLPVALTLGLMGALGIRLDVATVLVAAISLGVAVDDTIHFFYKFRAVLAATGDPVAAARETLETTGRAIAATSLVVTLGFASLCFASIETVSLFGALLCVTMLGALVAELLVTPAILLTFPPPSDAPAPDAPGAAPGAPAAPEPAP